MEQTHSTSSVLLYKQKILREVLFEDETRQGSVAVRSDPNGSVARS